MNKIPLEEFAKMYIEKFGDDSFNLIKREYDHWISYQENNEATSEEEKKKHEYVIWEDFPTAGSYILYLAKKREDAIKRNEEARAYMSLPWHDKILMEDGNCKIKEQLVEAFIKSTDGETIRRNLCVWNITSEILFDAIKHFVSYVSDRKFTDDEIKAFLERNKDSLNAMGYGVCSDGGRVFRTLKWACSLFVKEMT